jgi:nucleoside-diphosphate-sugar epimerase
MKIFLAGATGVIGRQLVPMLLQAGHEVTGSTRSPARAEQLRVSGARAAIVDALDREAMTKAVAESAPDAVIHQLTSIPARIDPRRLERDFALNDRLRTEGTAILLAAAESAGAKRIVAQSIAFSYAPGPPGTIHTESDPLLSDAQAGPSFQRSAAAVRTLEARLLEANGLVLRYGYFYGPGSAIAADGSTGREVARRRLPVVGGGGGVWSFIHIHDAASAALAALEIDPTHPGGAYNIVDDEPAPVRDWIPALAQALGAKPPRRVPAWLAKPLAGDYGVRIMTAAQGAANTLAKRELGWQPEFPSWREGFRTALG